MSLLPVYGEKARLRGLATGRNSPANDPAPLNPLPASGERGLLTAPECSTL
jgi:hypothetical protein